MIKVCYNNIRSTIKINSLLSGPFTLVHGVRQGRPLSESTEALANFIIVDTRIKGIQLEKSQDIKRVNFADDTAIF